MPKQLITIKLKVSTWFFNGLEMKKSRRVLSCPQAPFLNGSKVIAFQEEGEDWQELKRTSHLAKTVAKGNDLVLSFELRLQNFLQEFLLDQNDLRTHPNAQKTIEQISQMKDGIDAFHRELASDVVLRKSNGFDIAELAAQLQSQPSMESWSSPCPSLSRFHFIEAREVNRAPPIPKKPQWMTLENLKSQKKSPVKSESRSDVQVDVVIDGVVNDLIDALEKMDTQKT